MGGGGRESMGVCVCVRGAGGGEADEGMREEGD